MDRFGNLTNSLAAFFFAARMQAVYYRHKYLRRWWLYWNAYLAEENSFDWELWQVFSKTTLERIHFCTASSPTRRTLQEHTLMPHTFVIFGASGDLTSENWFPLFTTSCGPGSCRKRRKSLGFRGPKCLTTSGGHIFASQQKNMLAGTLFTRGLECLRADYSLSTWRY